MALLDVVITHHDEKWEIGRKMFEMLKLQRGVKPGEFRVILVQDGEDDKLDLERIVKVYPFVQLVIEIPESGVSAARNAGMDMAEAPYIMFCDFDDCLYSVDSMNRILQSCRQAGDRADVIWSDFWIEMRDQNGEWIKVKKGWNSVFIHGRVYLRSFLEEHGIRFDEELTYSEDAMFNALVAMETTEKRVARMPEVVYVWCYRNGSASNYDGGDEKRNLSLYRKRVKLCEAYEERGRTYDAKCAAARALLDYYWELNGQDELPGGSREEWKQRIRDEILSRWPGCVRDISGSDRKALLRVTRAEAEAKRLIRANMISPVEWLEEIDAV